MKHTKTKATALALTLAMLGQSVPAVEMTSYAADTDQASAIEETTLCGDVNLDGRIDITDAVLLNKYASGSVQLNAQQIANSDCHCDNVYDINDATTLMKFLVGCVRTLPEYESENPVVTTTTSTVYERHGTECAETTTAAVTTTTSVSELTSQFHCVDNIRAVTAAGWDKALGSDNTLVLTSEADMEELLSPLFENAVTDSLRQYYDSNFFENYVAFLSLTAKPDQNDWEYSISSVEQTDDGTPKIHVQKNYHNCLSEAGIDLLGVSVPKAQWNGTVPMWTTDGETELDAGFTSVSLYPGSVTDYADYSAWISSVDEWNNFLAQFVDVNAAEANLPILTASDFEDYKFYAFTTNDIYGTTYTPFRIAQDDDTGTISIHCRVKNPYSCDGTSQLQLLRVSKETFGETEPNISLISYNDEFYSNDGTWSYIFLPDSTQSILLNQYTYDGRSEIIVYRTNAEGLDLFANQEKIGALPLEDGFTLPAEGNDTSDWITNTDGSANIEVKKLSGLTITLTDGTIIFTYPINSNGDSNTVTYNITD